MANVFADTAGWASFFVRTENFHKSAVAFVNAWQTGGTRIVTTNYVILELVALLTRPLRVARDMQVEIVEALRSASWVDIVHIDVTLDAEAWLLLKERRDKQWSLVDCASFAVMRRNGLAAALTTDHHFEQAGFERLLK